MNVRHIALALAIPLVACGSSSAKPAAPAARDSILVFVAASVANAFKTQFAAYSGATGATVLTESGGSMEHARKITELGRIPDVIVLADDEVFPKLLSPQHVSWWATFAENRMVVAYTDKSAGHDSINADNWYRIVTRRGVEVGRSDPQLAPVGYRTLTLFKLAAQKYKVPGLDKKLLDNAPARNIRGNAADLAALLAAGELDYIYDYESVARTNGFRFVALPTDVTGPPARYALSIPRRAPHPAAAERLLHFLLSDSRRRALRAANIDMFDAPVVSGTGAPPFLVKAR
jgi:molybdate/tungstate transport system substrate-binding protein